MTKPTPYQPPKMVSNRPGSDAAYKLPSVENGKSVPAKKPAAMCVGTPMGFAWRETK